MSAERMVDIDGAVGIVRSGGLIAYPTEAVFGLGCDPARTDTIGRLLALKERGVDKGLILIAASLAQLQPWLTDIADPWRKRMDVLWPGPVTLLVPAAPHVPVEVRGSWQTVAVRVSAHPVVKQLCEACGHALVSTSANRSGEAPARTASEVDALFGQKIDAIVAGETGGRLKPSSIIDVRTGEQLRG